MFFHAAMGDSGRHWDPTGTWHPSLSVAAWQCSEESCLQFRWAYLSTVSGSRQLGAWSLSKPLCSGSWFSRILASQTKSLKEQSRWHHKLTLTLKTTLVMPSLVSMPNKPQLAPISRRYLIGTRRLRIRPMDKFYRLWQKKKKMRRVIYHPKRRRFCRKKRWLPRRQWKASAQDARVHTSYRARIA